LLLGKKRNKKKLKISQKRKSKMPSQEAKSVNCASRNLL
jgi:hypothetical protein